MHRQLQLILLRFLKYLRALAARFTQLAREGPRVVVPFLIMAVLYWFSSIPGTPLPHSPALYSLFYWMTPSVQNALHVPAYAALGWASHWALGGWLCVSSRRAIGACIIASTYGAIDEWHQSFILGRYASLTDVVLDVVGAALGIALAVWVNRLLAGRAALRTACDPTH